MSKDRPLEPTPMIGEQVAAIRPPSRLEILTATNVEPALMAMLSCMERLDGRVRIVLERDGTLLASGLGLKAWLDRSSCLTLAENTLKATSREGQIKLARLLSVATGDIETIILSRRQQDGHCILRGAGLCAEALAVTIQLADDSFEPKLANLEEAFGLTPSEMHIVEMLQAGLGAHDIGERLGISIHTVRAHLRHCYDKLGVSSREELWQRLAPYRLN